MKTQKKEKLKKIILVPVLIIGLAVFSFHITSVFAEGEETPPEQQPSEQQPSETTIQTGDAAGQVVVENDVNTNVTDLGETVSQTENPAEGTTTIEETAPTQEATSTPATDLEVQNENVAVVGNNIEGTIGTGGNGIEGSGNSSIETGNANLVVGLVNTVNSNLTGSDFSQFLYNIFGNSQGDIDLTDEISNSTSTCCPSEIDVSNTNLGTIENSIVANVSTGDNSVTTHNGATIETGDANVVTDVFNVLNTNIFGSNWNHLIINIFGNWFGDLVLPGEAALNNYLNPESSGCPGGCGETTVANYNAAGIENEVAINSDTGQNTINGGSGIIRTGSANTISNIFNLTNTNVTGGNWFFMAVNNFGSWSGNIFSLPTGFITTDDSAGVKIYNLDSQGFHSPTDNTNLDIQNTNTGSIKNSVIVNVSTGGNSINSQGDSAVIETGDANVVTNLVNVLNSNISGNNWLLGMINVFGEWNGDLAFGRPDLWIGETAGVPAHRYIHAAMTGDPISYTIYYHNSGNAYASNVILSDDFDQNFIEEISDTGGGTVTNGRIQWDLGTIPAGASGVVSYVATVRTNIPFGTHYIVNHSNISSFEEDWQYEDNSDSISVETYRALEPGAILEDLNFQESSSSRSTIPPNLEINKVNHALGIVDSSSTVDYTIKLYNNSNGEAYDVIVEDMLYDKDMNLISTTSWSLGTVFSHEEINIDYTVAIRADAPSGFYINYARATGYDGPGNPISSGQASTTIEVKGKSEEAEKELSIEDIINQIEEIRKQVKIINDQINRFLPLEQTNGVENVSVENASSENTSSENANAENTNRKGFIGNFLDILTNPPPTSESFTSSPALANYDGVKKDLDKFLASVGTIFGERFADFKRPWWVSPLALLMSLVFLNSLLKQKEKQS